jgi:hypothetical protein
MIDLGSLQFWFVVLQVDETRIGYIIRAGQNLNRRNSRRFYQPIGKTDRGGRII